MVINSPCLTDKKELAIPGQTATGKEFSNPLMAGSLPKTISAKFWNTSTSKTVNSVKQIHAIVDGKAVVISESSVRSDLFFNDEDGIACLTNDEIFENLALMGYEQLSTKLTFQKGNGYRWQSQAPRNHGGAHVQTRSERELEKPNEPPLLKGHTSGSGEGRMEHTFELIENVLDLEKEKDAQAVEILKLKKRVKKLERKMKSSISHLRRRIYRQVESSDDDLDKEDASKQGRTGDKTKPMFIDSDFDVLDDDIENIEEETVNAAIAGVSVVSAPVTTAGIAISTAEPRTPPTTAATTFIDEDLTIAQTLVKIRSEKAKEKGVAFRGVEETPRLTRSTTTLQPLLTIDPKDKGKGVLVEEELEKPEKQEEATNAALTEEFDEIQARMDADHELAVRLTHEEQEKYTIEKRARLLAEYFERRKKQLAAERSEAIRNKPPTRAQVRNMMITYLKYMGKYTHQQLKHKTLEELQKLYQKEQKWINDFKPMGSKEDGSNTKKGGKMIKRSADSTTKKKLPKKPKVIKEQESAESNEEAAADYEQENEEFRMWLTVVPDEDETIIRADGNTSYHKTFSSMLRKFDRQDLMDLHRLVMKRFEDNTPEGYNLLPWGDLKVMFEPNVEDEIWSNQQDWTLISWKLYENCGVHLLLMDGTLTCFNMLVEKIYPLIKEMLEKMLNWKLEAEADSTMAFELLKFIKSINRRVSSLETELSELKQTNQFVEVLSSIPGIVDNYLASKMKDEVNVAIQLKSNKLREEAQAENEEFLNQIESNIKAIIKDQVKAQVKAQVSKIFPKVEKFVTKSLEAEVLARSSNQPQTSYAAKASLSEFELKKILIDKIDENKSMNR
ncbi:hypothetical protein Tco_1272473 [Tanacetum coccineum]